MTVNKEDCVRSCGYIHKGIVQNIKLSVRDIERICSMIQWSERSLEEREQLKNGVLGRAKEKENYFIRLGKPAKVKEYERVYVRASHIFSYLEKE